MLTRRRPIRQIGDNIRCPGCVLRRVIVVPLISSIDASAIRKGAHACRASNGAIRGHRSRVRGIGVVDRRVGGLFKGLIDDAGAVLLLNGRPLHLGILHGSDTNLVVRIEVEDIRFIMENGRSGLVEERGHFERWWNTGLRPTRAQRAWVRKCRTGLVLN